MSSFNLATAARLVQVTPSDTNYLTAAGWINFNGSQITPSAINLGTETFTASGSGLANGDIIVFDSVGTVTGIAINTPYYVIGVSGSAFQISSTFGGSAINLGGATTTMPVFREVQQYQAAMRKTGFISVTTSGTYRVLPAAHFDTNDATVAPMYAQSVYIVAGVPFPLELKKVFSTGSASTSGIVLLTSL